MSDFFTQGQISSPTHKTSRLSNENGTQKFPVSRREKNKRFRFTSAKFQLNIHEVFILLGWKHLYYISLITAAAAKEGHFLGDLSEGKQVD